MKIKRLYLLFFALINGLISCKDSSTNNQDLISFESDTWLNGDRRMRGRMVKSMISDSILVGKSKTEVLSLLGEPTASGTSSPLVYEIDMGEKIGPFGIGGTWLFFLTIQFDSVENKVNQVRYSD